MIFFSGLTTLDVDHTLHLGGLETFPSFFPDPDDIDPHFEGCMRNLKLNGKEYPLTPAAGWKGLSIGTLVFQLLDVIRGRSRRLIFVQVRFSQIVREMHGLRKRGARVILTPRFQNKTHLYPTDYWWVDNRINEFDPSILVPNRAPEMTPQSHIKKF